MDERLVQAYREASAAPGDAQARLRYARALFQAGRCMVGLHETLAAARELGVRAVRALIVQRARVLDPRSGALLPLQRSDSSAPSLDEVLAPLFDEDYPGARVAGLRLHPSSMQEGRAPLLFLGAGACRACKGTGGDDDDACPACGGNGFDVDGALVGSDCAHSWVARGDRVGEWPVVRCESCSLSGLRTSGDEAGEVLAACAACRRFGCSCGRLY